MSKPLTILASVCALLLLAACAGLAVSDPAPQAEDQPEPQAEALSAEETEAPEYETLPLVYGNQFRSEDEEEVVLAHYNYQIILLTLHNPDAVSLEDAEAAQVRIDAFNSRMNAVAEDLVEQGKTMAEDASAVYAEFGPLLSEYEDDAAIGANFCGSIISACLVRETWTGGAHPNHYKRSYLFDLASGQFIDPTQLAEDPEAFRTGAAALLLEKAEAHEGREVFWQDYADVIARWNESAVQFAEDGMHVIYSPYEIGPYSAGEIEFTLSWEELAPLIGETGLARLGRDVKSENQQ